jgi:hypothetical protein
MVHVGSKLYRNRKSESRIPWLPPCALRPRARPRVRDVMGHSSSALMIENACAIEYEQRSLVLKDLA